AIADGNGVDAVMRELNVVDGIGVVGGGGDVDVVELPLIGQGTRADRGDGEKNEIGARPNKEVGWLRLDLESSETGPVRRIIAVPGKCNSLERRAGAVRAQRPRRAIHVLDAFDEDVRHGITVGRVW